MYPHTLHLIQQETLLHGDLTTLDLSHQSPSPEFKWKLSLSEGHISAKSYFFFILVQKIQAMPTDSTASFTYIV